MQAETVCSIRFGRGTFLPQWIPYNPALHLQSDHLSPQAAQPQQACHRDGDVVDPADDPRGKRILKALAKVAPQAGNQGGATPGLIKGARMGNSGSRLPIIPSGTQQGTLPSCSTSVRYALFSCALSMPLRVLASCVLQRTHVP
ncbi:hypothetical protein PGB28_20940 [Primorskyibacter aestuariivivens]|uniref:hypothetical protein n=1 Tax=Primorskyibacter aestuariivivens TaxID=1888912 RepID=UPI002301E47A|nr:hypothetical protein [Primorskyibacter aestuariivivens]MDA7430932.1 hypothetical protein [Primorskyibacter aestuariivivens]